MVSALLLYYRTLFSQSAASTTMGSLAAYLRINSINVKLLLLKRANLQKNELQVQVEIVEHLRNHDDTVIIAKANFKDFNLLLPILKLIKQHFRSHVFLCGPFASLNAESILLDNEWIDGIVVGYPEKTVLDIVTKIELKEDYHNVAGLSYLRGDGKYICIPQQFTLSLNDLPLPERDIESLSLHFNTD